MLYTALNGERYDLGEFQPAIQWSAHVSLEMKQRIDATLL